MSDLHTPLSTSDHRLAPRQVFLSGWLLTFGLGCAAPAIPNPFQGALDHRGPGVRPGESGPYPHARLVMKRFDLERATSIAEFVDGFYREPGNDGFEQSLDRVIAELKAVGYGRAEGLELEVIETPLRGPAWTPISAELAVSSRGKWKTVLGFDEPSGAHRCMLPTNCSSADVEGPLVTSLEGAPEGAVLLTDQPLGRSLREASRAGACAVLSSHLMGVNVDPSGRKRHLDAIHYGRVRSGTELAVAHISPRAYSQLFEAYETSRKRGQDTGPAVRFRAEVKLDERPLRTVVARILGSERPEEVVAVAAHVQEPGAVDNASGVAGLCEGARVLASAIQSGTLERPRRTLALVWGDEMDQTRIFLDHTERTPVAGFSSDMTGASRSRTGAICLLERERDPGALVTLPPDEHSEWGAGSVREDQLNPSGLSIIARCAMFDVGMMSEGWETADHPWEGGSDHDIFLGRGVPAVLFWHFTDFAYHTSLDRMEHVDVEELRRTTAALLAAAMAVSDARPGDLNRYLESLRIDRRVRLRAAEEAGNEELAGQWTEWFDGARHWLRELCLGQ